MAIQGIKASDKTPSRQSGLLKTIASQNLILACGDSTLQLPPMDRMASLHNEERLHVADIDESNSQKYHQIVKHYQRQREVEWEQLITYAESLKCHNDELQDLIIVTPTGSISSQTDTLPRQPNMPKYEMLLKERRFLRERIEDLLLDRDAAVRDLEILFERARGTALESSSAESVREAREMAYFRHEVRLAMLEHDQGANFSHQELDFLSKKRFGKLDELRDRVSLAEADATGWKVEYETVVVQRDALEEELVRIMRELHSLSGEQEGLPAVRNRQSSMEHHDSYIRQEVSDLIETAKTTSLEDQLKECESIIRRKDRELETTRQDHYKALTELRQTKHIVCELQDILEVERDSTPSNGEAGDSYGLWLKELYEHANQLPQSLQAASRLKGEIYQWYCELRRMIRIAPRTLPPATMNTIDHAKDQLVKKDVEIKNLTYHLDFWKKRAQQLVQEFQANNILTNTQPDDIFSAIDAATTSTGHRLMAIASTLSSHISQLLMSGSFLAWTIRQTRLTKSSPKFHPRQRNNLLLLQLPKASSRLRCRFLASPFDEVGAILIDHGPIMHYMLDLLSVPKPAKRVVLGIRGSESETSKCGEYGDILIYTARASLHLFQYRLYSDLCLIFQILSSALGRK